MRAIGILGGMFDPPHIGHLRIALEIYEGLGLEEVRLLPCFRPPHRAPTEVTASHRLKMVHLAVEAVGGLTVDDREVSRAGVSYMVDTLHSLRAELGKQPVCLVVGMDAFCKITSWHRWQEFRDLCHIVVASRPPQDMDAIDTVLQELGMERCHVPEELRRRAAGYMLPWPVTQLAISSSMIRRLIKDGRNPRFLLPDVVLEYLKNNRLYEGSKRGGRSPADLFLND